MALNTLTYNIGCDCICMGLLSYVLRFVMIIIIILLLKSEYFKNYNLTIL